MDRTGWVRGGDRSAGQPMQRSGWIRAARCIAESFWRSVIVANEELRLGLDAATQQGAWGSDRGQWYMGAYFTSGGLSG